jgi:uncharacterized membrane protein
MAKPTAESTTAALSVRAPKDFRIAKLIFDPIPRVANPCCNPVSLQPHQGSPGSGEEMDTNIEHVFAFEPVVSDWIHLVGTCIEIFGVFIIVAGVLWSTSLFVPPRADKWHYDRYKIRIGRSLLLGLEVLVAADIVKTIAIELTFTSLGLLAGLVLVRTFLSWTLVLEIDGRWPWQRQVSRAE